MTRTHAVPSGQVLVSTREAVHLIDSATGLTVRSVEVDAAGLSVAVDAGVAVATARPVRSFGVESQWAEPESELAATVLRLPDLSVERSVTLPGLMLKGSTLSDDGKSVLIQADHIGSARESLVAIDMATGRELARRRPPLSAKPHFMPDGQTVSIGKASDDGKVPVELWRVRTD